MNKNQFNAHIKKVGRIRLHLDKLKEHGRSDKFMRKQWLKVLGCWVEEE